MLADGWRRVPIWYDNATTSEEGATSYSNSGYVSSSNPFHDLGVRNWWPWPAVSSLSILHPNQKGSMLFHTEQDLGRMALIQTLELVLSLGALWTYQARTRPLGCLPGPLPGYQVPGTIFSAKTFCHQVNIFSWPQNRKSSTKKEFDYHYWMYFRIHQYSKLTCHFCCKKTIFETLEALRFNL